MPSYEEMIVAALEELHDSDGLAPKTVFDYMNSLVEMTSVTSVRFANHLHY